MTPEGKVKARVKRILKKHEVYYFMPVQTGYGMPTLDFLCCHRGSFFAIETKAPGKKPTTRQKIIIAEMLQASAEVFVIDGSEGSFDSLENWLQDT